MEIINVTFTKFANGAAFNQLNQLNKSDEKVNSVNLQAKPATLLCVYSFTSAVIYFTNKTCLN